MDTEYFIADWMRCLFLMQITINSVTNARAQQLVGTMARGRVIRPFYMRYFNFIAGVFYDCVCAHAAA